jgi:2-polyprenyl-3-methyl-5-hydroxy-6-metoxy-1,4-benzoquinol methylase
MSSFTYVGDELTLFSAAKNWKSYLRREITPLLGREVLEVGAGLGGTTKFLCNGNFDRWICLEPDAALAERLDQEIREGQVPPCCQVAVGTLENRTDYQSFDTLLYIDVLEHIGDDKGEVVRGLSFLRPGGRLVVLSPAHQWLFSEFDRAIGHFRRYTRASLKAITPQGATIERLVYLDSVGLLASLGNRVLLKKAMPTPRQIGIWDGVMVPLSRALDLVLLHGLGKSVLAVWRKS